MGDLTSPRLSTIPLCAITFKRGSSVAGSSTAHIAPPFGISDSRLIMGSGVGV